MSEKNWNDMTHSPIDKPNGDQHHTEIPFTAEDKKQGDGMAWAMGTVFRDAYGDYQDCLGCPNCGISSVDQWTRISRALRFHGLKIVRISGQS